ncbi:hypothetical protein [Streptomyces sp. NPDC002403]
MTAAEVEEEAALGCGQLFLDDGSAGRFTEMISGYENLARATVTRKPTPPKVQADRFIGRWE